MYFKFTFGVVCLFSKPVLVLEEKKRTFKKVAAGKFALVYKWKKVNIQTKRITFIFTTKDVSPFSSSPSNHWVYYKASSVSKSDKGLL